MDELYRVREGRVAVVDVPELDYLSVQGRGVAGGPEFRAAALEAIDGPQSPVDRGPVSRLGQPQRL